MLMPRDLGEEAAPKVIVEGGSLPLYTGGETIAAILRIREDRGMLPTNWSDIFKYQHHCIQLSAVGGLHRPHQRRLQVSRHFRVKISFRSQVGGQTAGSHTNPPEVGILRMSAATGICVIVPRLPCRCWPAGYLLTHDRRRYILKESQGESANPQTFTTASASLGLSH